MPIKIHTSMKSPFLRRSRFPRTPLALSRSRSLAICVHCHSIANTTWNVTEKRILEKNPSFAMGDAGKPSPEKMLSNGTRSVSTNHGGDQLTILISWWKAAVKSRKACLLTNGWHWHGAFKKYGTFVLLCCSVDTNLFSSYSTKISQSDRGTDQNNRIFALRLRKCLFQDPGIAGFDSFIIILMDANFLKPMTFIESLSIVIGYLHVEVYLAEFGLWMGWGCGEDQFQGLGTKLSWPVWLCEHLNQHSVGQNRALQPESPLSWGTGPADHLCFLIGSKSCQPAEGKRNWQVEHLLTECTYGNIVVVHWARKWVYVYRCQCW